MSRISLAISSIIGMEHTKIAHHAGTANSRIYSQKAKIDFSSFHFHMEWRALYDPSLGVCP
jgi:hypothetical protein